MPKVQPVAMVIMGGMATEASCERVFSAASLVKTKHRNQLGAEVLDMQVFVKVNMAKLKRADGGGRLVRYDQGRVRQIQDTPDAIHTIPDSISL